MEGRAVLRPRWQRDNRILVAIGAGLGGALAVLYALFLKARELSPSALTNRVLLFVLFYIVVLLILVLLFVLGRNAVRLLLEARRGVFGSRFRVRIVLTHVGLALLPIALLLLPVTGLLQRSVEFWFEPPVAETVRAGKAVVELVRNRSGTRERRTAERLAPTLQGSARDDGQTVALLAEARRESELDFLEWIPEGPGAGSSLAVSSARWPVREVSGVGQEWAAEAHARGLSRRIEQTAGGGQASRTAASLPGGILVLGTYDPPDEAAPLRDLARATSTYAMLQAERSSLRAIQVLFFLLLALVVLLASVWAGLVLAHRVTRPIAALASSARRVGAGDFDALVDVEGGDEIAELATAFNSMTQELKVSRERLEKAYADMADANHRLDEERRRIRTVLAHLDAGVIAFGEADSGGVAGESRLLALNETGRRLLGRPEGTADPDRLCDLVGEEWLAPLRDFLCRAVLPSGPREAIVSISPPGAAEPRVVEARIVRVPASTTGPAGWVVTMEDTTALVKAERAAAWEEAARRMAHEIKNPLTPIRLAAERMLRKAKGAAGPGLVEVVEEGAATIVEEVGTLSGLVDTFGRFARLPAPSPAPTDLGAIVRQVVSLYARTKTGVSVLAGSADGLPPVRADAEQIKRALINLVDNAVSATPAGGTVSVKASVTGTTARVLVSDDGPGIAPADRGRVFDPSFSTKPAGTGLGLAITARIAAEHGGRVTLEENLPCGSRFVLEWPAA